MPVNMGIQSRKSTKDLVTSADSTHDAKRSVFRMNKAKMTDVKRDSRSKLFTQRTLNRIRHCHVLSFRRYLVAYVLRARRPRDRSAFPEVRFKALI